MTSIFETADRDGDRLFLYQGDPLGDDRYVAELNAHSPRRGTGASVYLTREDVAHLRASLDAIHPSERASNYDEGYADGFAAGVDEGSGLVITRTLDRRRVAALKKAVALAQQGTNGPFGGTKPTYEAVLAYAQFLLGELPQPTE